MDRKTAIAELVRLLEGLRAAAGDPVAANAFYPAHRWWDARVRRDLWDRACCAVDSGALPRPAVQLWGHWYGVSDGYVWSRAEIRRRLGVGRAAADTAIARVNAAVARHLRDDPPPPAPREGRGSVRAANTEDGAAVALGRAVVERHPHREEIGYALYDLCDRAEPVGPRGVRRLPPGTGLRKHNLKTSRYMPAARTALRRAAADASLRGFGDVPGFRLAVLPLWEPADTSTCDLEEALGLLRRMGPAGDRATAARLLRDGHQHILRRSNDRDAVCEFLFMESAILGEHSNIGCAAILEILEHLLDPADPRRVDTAQAREHILERHHYWKAAQMWSDRVWQRLGDPRIRWASADDKRVAAARALERRTALAAKLASVSPDLAHFDLPGMARRIRWALDRVEDPAKAQEWWHVAQRRELQARWATKNRDRLLGLPAQWDDDELAAIEVIDRTAARLGLPARTLSWNNQKLNVLLTADRPADFLHAVERFLPALSVVGRVWPTQVSSARSTLELALRRRSRQWRAVHSDLAALTARLPAHTDDVLRNPYAIPRELIVNGVAIG